MDQSTVPGFVIALTRAVVAGKSAMTRRFEAPSARMGPLSQMPVILLASPIGALVGGSLIALRQHDHQPRCHWGSSFLLQVGFGLLLAIS